MEGGGQSESCGTEEMSGKGSGRGWPLSWNVKGKLALADNEDGIHGGGGGKRKIFKPIHWGRIQDEAHWQTANKPSGTAGFGARKVQKQYLTLQGLAIAEKYTSIHKQFLIVSEHRWFSDSKRNLKINKKNPIRKVYWPLRMSQALYIHFSFNILDNPRNRNDYLFLNIDPFQNLKITTTQPVTTVYLLLTMN